MSDILNHYDAGCNRQFWDMWLPWTDEDNKLFVFLDDVCTTIRKEMDVK